MAQTPSNESLALPASGSYLHEVKQVSKSPLLSHLFRTFIKVKELAEFGRNVEGPGLTVFRWIESGFAEQLFLAGEELSEGGFVDEQLPVGAFAEVIDEVLSVDPAVEFVLLLVDAATRTYTWVKVAKFRTWLADLEFAPEAFGAEEHFAAWSRFPTVEGQAELAEAVAQGTLSPDDLTDRQFEALYQRTREEMNSGLLLPGESEDSRHVLDARRLERLFCKTPSLFDEP